MTLQLGEVPAQDSKTATLVLMPKQTGKFVTKVVASAGNISDQAIHEMTVEQAQMSLSIDGPSRVIKPARGLDGQCRQSRRCRP